MDTVQVIIVVLIAFTAIVWAHSWMLDTRDDLGDQPVQRSTPVYHGEAMLGVEEY
jgi:hypothetical protein